MGRYRGYLDHGNIGSLDDGSYGEGSLGAGSLGDGSVNYESAVISEPIPFILTGQDEYILAIPNNAKITGE